MHNNAGERGRSLHSPAQSWPRFEDQDPKRYFSLTPHIRGAPGM